MTASADLPEPAEDVVHFHDAETTLTPCGLDVWQDPEEEDPGSYVSSTTRHGSVTCEACRATFTAAPDDVLDLVRQYGDARCLMGIGGDYAANAGEAAVAFARIAALVAQQPVQARDEGGRLMWIHTCGFSTEAEASPLVCGYCEQAPGPWRPLLVARTDASAPEAKDSCHCESYDCNAILAQVMVEMGVTDPAEVLETLRQDRETVENNFNAVVQQRDEARAEVDRLQGVVRDEIEQADGHAAWVDRLAWAALKRTGVHETEEASGNEELWQLALDALTAQSDPLVLSLPTVPEGAVALVGAIRYERSGDDPHTLWRHPSGVVVTLGEVFDNERADGDGTVRVEMAPPREPRTWESLEVADEGLKVRGASGNVYAFTGVIGRRRAHVEKIGDRFMGCWMSLAELREFDGPLTEVFDEPGGAR